MKLVNTQYELKVMKEHLLTECTNLSWLAYMLLGCEITCIEKKRKAKIKSKRS